MTFQKFSSLTGTQQFSIGTHPITDHHPARQEEGTCRLKFQVITCHNHKRSQEYSRIKKPSQSIRPHSLPVSALLCCQYSWNKFPHPPSNQATPFTRIHFLQKALCNHLRLPQQWGSRRWSAHVSLQEESETRSTYIFTARGVRPLPWI